MTNIVSNQEGPVGFPPPGLDGTYRDSCMVCLRGSDTGLAFRGEAEFVLAGLHHLGIPDDQCEVLVSHFTGCDPGKVPVGAFTFPVRVCGPCAEAGGKLTVGLISTGIPLYGPRDRSGDA
jgi:hypothetical protein